LATRALFFDAELVGDPAEPDRVYQLPDSFPPIFRSLVTNGVQSGLTVAESAPSAMSVQVGIGTCFIDGFFFEVLDAPETVPLAPAHPSLTRIDRIVVQLDRGDRDIDLQVVPGAPGAGAPAVPADAQLLATVTVGAGATQIEDSNIADGRLRLQVRNGGSPAVDDRDLVNFAHMRDYVARAAPYELRSRTTTSSDQTIPNGTATAINVDNATSVDRQGFWTAAGTTYTIVVPGVYEIEAGVRWQSNSSGVRQLLIAVNAGFVAGNRVPASLTGAFDMAISRTVPLQAGDVVTAQVVQTSGGNLGIDPVERTYRNIRFVRPL
jgi:hypothetical protein